MTLLGIIHGVFVELLCGLSGTYTFTKIMVRFNSPIVNYIGQNTLPIYLIHSLFLAISRKISFVFAASIPLTIIISWIIGIIGPLVIVKMSDNYPFIKKIFYPRKKI
jgi:fucose 4-O-acetylase-like acetyltransferase